MKTFMLLKGVHHVAVICSQYKVSKDFYVNKLGFTIINELYREERQSYKLDLDAGGGVQLELFSFPQPPKRPSFPEAAGLRHLAFAVNDIEEVVNNLKHKGIECEEIRIDLNTNQRFTFFQDPDGLPLELYETQRF